MYQSIEMQFLQMADVLKRFSTPENFAKIRQAAGIMAQAIRTGQKIMSCGNGGSMCDAIHFAEELTGKFQEDRAPFPAIAISDPGHISCVGNDYGFENIFSRYIEGLGKAGDVLLAISTSGNSPNIVKAAKTAQEMGIPVVALTGNDGGKLAELATIEIRVPHFKTAERIQEVHIKVIHTLIYLIEQEFWNWLPKPEDVLVD